MKSLYSLPAIVLLALAAFLIPPATLAQTRTAPSQARPGSTPVVPSNLRPMGYTISDDRYRAVRLGSGLLVTPNADGSVSITVDLTNLRVTAALVSRSLTRQADGTWTGADQTCAIYRNGILQRTGEDFTLNPTNAVTPAAGFPWQADDYVTGLCPSLSIAP